MKKRISLLLICILFLDFTIINCSLVKDKMDKEQFTSIMVNNEFTVEDVTDQYANYNFISSVQVALPENKEFQIEFYIFDSKINAKKAYQNSKYVTPNKDNYRYMKRIDNTIIYVNTKKKNKDKVKRIIKKLNY